MIGVLQWIQAIEDPDATFESLARSGKKYKGLDLKLAAAGMKIAHGEIGREIILAAELAAKEARLLRGRQIMWRIYRWFRTAEAAGNNNIFQQR